MLASGTPRLVSFAPRYPISAFQFFPSVFCSVKFHCCAYPDPVSVSTPKTPWPRPEFGFGGMICTAGPCDKTKAGLILSCDLCPELWMKGKNGTVNGVVIPACSIHTRPYPERMTNESVTLYAKLTRGPKSCQSSRRADLGTPFWPRKSSCCVLRLKTAPRLFASVDGKFRVYRRPRPSERRSV